MADDADDRVPAPDPWDEIVAEGLGDDGAEETLRFEEPAGDTPPPVEPSDGDQVEPGPDVAAAAAEALRGDAEEAGIEEWLSGDDGQVDAGSPVLSVFAPEENAPGLSGVDIGTGTSGIAQDGEPALVQDEIGDDAFPAESAAGGSSTADWADVEPVPAAAAAAGDDTDGTFDVTTAGAAAAPAVVAATGRRAGASAGKSGGIGRVLGIVLGGLLAIPVTLAILLFGLGQDPFGLATLVPSQAAFLLPATMRPAPPQPPMAVVAAPVDAATLDEVPPVPDPGMPEPASSEPASPEPAMPEPAEPVAAVTVADEAASIATEPEPAAPADLAAVGDAAPVEPQPAAEPEPEPMPMPEPPLDAVAVATPDLDAPGLDALVAEPPAIPPPAPQPPPLDTVALDEAVGEAAALGEALGAVDDRENRAYALLRTRWYRSLARVAEELVALEHVAAAAGRPLDTPPENVALLHGTIVGREALATELAALAPDWLSYAKRGSDGVVLPVTFDSARKVGPYWTARVTLTAAAGQPRTVMLICRSEPAAAAGDRLVVTGVALDGGVIWAADVRATAAGADPAPGF
jgi:hypothetical protein